ASAPLRRLREKLPLVALSAAGSVLTLLAQEAALETGAAVALPDRIANVPLSAVGYLEKTFWPVGLSVLVPHPALPGGGGLPTPRVAGAALALALLAALAWRLRTRRAYVAAGLLWYGAALAPVIGLVQ